MYLSKIVFNPNNPEARDDLNSPYELHRTLCAGFDEDKRPRILFRQMDRKPQVLLLSDSAPDFQKQLRGGRLLRVDSKAFNPTIKEGLRLRFQLKANPTKKSDGKRLGIEDPQEQVNWLSQKGRQHGFRLLGAQVVRCDVSKTRRPSGGVMVHLWAEFHGALEVTDAAEFQKCLESGVGSAKAFGFGMLMVSG